MLVRGYGIHLTQIWFAQLLVSSQSCERVLMEFPGLMSFTLLHYALAITAVVLFYVYYTQPDDCTEHKVFISLNLIFCVLISVVSILPKIQVQHGPE